MGYMVEGNDTVKSKDGHPVFSFMNEGLNGGVAVSELETMASVTENSVSDTPEVDSMFDFVRNNMQDIRIIAENENGFLCNKSGNDIMLLLYDKPPGKGWPDFLTKLQADSENGIYSAHLLIRSTKDYDGKFFREITSQRREMDALRRNDRVSLRRFERELDDLYRAVDPRYAVPYFNPTANRIDIPYFERIVTPVELKEGQEEVKRIRQAKHVHDSYKEAYRRFELKTKRGRIVNGPFTLAPYEKNNIKLARIVQVK